MKEGISIKKSFFLMLVLFCVVFLTACSDFEEVASKQAEISYKVFEIQHDEEQDIDIEVEVIKTETINFNQFSSLYKKYTSIKFEIANTSEMDSACGFDLYFESLENHDISFNFEISNGRTALYSNEITIKKDEEYELYFDDLGFTLSNGDIIYFNFSNLEYEIKVRDILIIGKEKEDSDEDLYSEDDLIDDDLGND